MDLIVKHFNELSTTELYEILKTRFEIFVAEQECIYQDFSEEHKKEMRKKQFPADLDMAFQMGARLSK